MPQKFSPAPEVEDVARRLIDDFHPHLSTIRIDYVFASEPLKEKGKVVWGRAKKIGGLNAWLASETKFREAATPEEFFVIEICKQTWQQLDEKSRRALTDHELSHLDVDMETGKLSLLPHDLEEFNSIVRRYGLWRADVEFFIRAANGQKDLFEATKNEDDDRYFDGVLDRVADDINSGALGPDVTATVTRGARA
jgi:hypothetical protein